MVNSIKHKCRSPYTFVWESVCKVWAVNSDPTSFALQHSPPQEIFGQRMFLNSPAQKSKKKKSNWSCLGISYGVLLRHWRGCYILQAYNGCLPNNAIFASRSPSLLIKLLPATLETQTHGLRTVTIPTLAPLPASAQIRSIQSSIRSHKFKQEESVLYLFSDTLSS